MLKYVLQIFIFTFLFETGWAQKKCDTVVVKLDTAAFKAKLTKNDGVLIDVRTQSEWNTGYIKGAINIDYRSADFEKKISNLDKRKTYYLYCATGARSGKAAAYMKSQGFCKVYTLDRGLHAWIGAGYPVIKP